jgi:Ca2+-dependent lipid-binding protein
VWINGYYSKTEIIRKTLNPTWDHVISVPVDPSVQEVSLQMEVWDWDRIGTDDFLYAGEEKEEKEERKGEGWRRRGTG